ncbi:MAG: twin-arginine translocation signal domain-containing protein, partial [Gemmatimonadota bacterium]|nr:twin-arginine translocation signal domain-containing protein [Gemmatimonadota bacterium]
MDPSLKAILDEAGKSSNRSKDREALTRRAFLKQAAFAAAAMAAPFPVLADPYAPQAGSNAAAGAQPASLVRPVRPVRVSGRVTAGRASLAGVAVTDGLTVTSTDADGRFELVSNTLQSFVSISTPDGYAIAQNPSGTASFYRPITADESGEMAARFDLAALDGSDERHGFLVLSDPQTQDAYEMGLFHAETVPDVQETAAALSDRRLFGVGCGDIMFDDLTLYPEYERGVGLMDMPFFQVVGNHDLDFGPTDDGSVRT